jgi:hypothetical protein
LNSISSLNYDKSKNEDLITNDIKINVPNNEDLKMKDIIKIFKDFIKDKNMNLLSFEKNKEEEKEEDSDLEENNEIENENNSAEFKSSRGLRDNKNLVEKNYKTYTANTAIRETVFALDIEKFWYIKFVYHFIYKWIYLSKINFIKGCPDKDSHQGFKHVIKDEVFNKENVYK